MLELTYIIKTFSTCYSPVLDQINLELSKGDFCIIVGCNGSGKSTLLKAISGEHTIDSGNIKINDVDFTHRNRSQLIATVGQDVNKGTIAEMTLYENMVLSLMRQRTARFKFYGSYKNQIGNQIQELGLGLENFLHQSLSNLSGGQRQVIATIMAVNSNPQLLLLDEHTSALDPIMEKFLMNYTSNIIKEQKVTTLMITHRLNDAIKYGNRLIMLKKGKIALDLNEASKKKLTIEELLALYHRNETSTLILGE